LKLEERSFTKERDAESARKSRKEKRKIARKNSRRGASKRCRGRVSRNLGKNNWLRCQAGATGEAFTEGEIPKEGPEKNGKIG